MINKSDQRILANEICTAESLNQASELWTKYHSLLPNSRFFFGIEGRGPQGLRCNRTFSKGGALRSIFRRERLFVFDEVLMQEMARAGTVTYPFDHTIMLDTNAVSCVENVMTGRRDRIPEDFEEALGQIIAEDLNFDGAQYLIENARNVGRPHANEKIFRKLVAYETLKGVDRAHFLRTREIRSTRSQEEVFKGAQETMSWLLYQKDSGDLSELEKVMPARYMYLILLKIAEIELSHSRGCPAAKMRSLITFMHEDLATIFMGEAMLAKAFFTLGKENFRFFSKVQRKNEELLSVLDNMAYDLQLVRMLELGLTFEPREGTHFLPFLLTFDKALVQVFDLYAVRAVAVLDGEPLCFRAINVINELSEGQSGDFVARFFSEEAAQEREQRRDVAKTPVAVNKQIAYLEARLT